jgi:hypothetical protein
MKIYFRDQSEKLSPHLDTLKDVPVMKYDIKKLKEKKSVIVISSENKLQDIHTRSFFDYNIFPSEIISFLTQWSAEKRTMQVGDTIVQQVYIPPLRNFSQKIIFGVRINEVIDTPNKKGFTYETLIGHVERGVSSFFLENSSTGLIFTIQTFSEPSNPFVKLLGPFFSLPYQAYCTKKALECVRANLLNEFR